MEGEGGGKIDEARVLLRVHVRVRDRHDRTDLV